MTQKYSTNIIVCLRKHYFKQMINHFSLHKSVFLQPCSYICVVLLPKKGMGNYFNNGQRVPTIFEIVTALENGDGGYIQQKKDDYKRIYGTLTDDEKSFVFRHPGYAYRFNANAEKARRIGREVGGTSNGYGDAVRHCYWCALNQMAAGLNSPLAREFGDAHENKPDNDINVRAMDLHNNSVGYYLGNQAIINGWNE